MPREFAPVNLDIWSDPDFLDLPPAPQHLYLTLWTSPALTYCGVHDWRPGRLAARSRGWTAEHIQTVADCLVARHFLVIDHETEEVLVRSWARFDGLLKQPRMAVSYANAYATVASATLRGVLAHETTKEHDRHPELTCWSDKRVAGILEHPAISAKGLPTPSDPFGDWVGDGFGLGLPQTAPNVWAKVSVPPTPSPSPAPISITPESTPRKRGVAIPDDWQPTEAHRSIAAEERVDCDREAQLFRDGAVAKNRKYVDWDAAFRNWLRSPYATKVTTLAIVSDPSQLPPVEDSWMRRRPK